MTKATQAVLADALRLDADARAELVAELLATLDGPADADAESAWDAEIQTLRVFFVSSVNRERAQFPHPSTGRF